MRKHLICKLTCKKVLSTLAGFLSFDDLADSQGKLALSLRFESNTQNLYINAYILLLDNTTQQDIAVVYVLLYNTKALLFHNFFAMPVSILKSHQLVSYAMMPVYTFLNAQTSLTIFVGKNTNLLFSRSDLQRQSFQADSKSLIISQITLLKICQHFHHIHLPMNQQDAIQKKEKKLSTKHMLVTSSYQKSKNSYTTSYVYKMKALLGQTKSIDTFVKISFLQSKFQLYYINPRHSAISQFCQESTRKYVKLFAKSSMPESMNHPTPPIDCNSSVLSRKDGKSLRIVHSLEPLNQVTIKYTGVTPFIDQIEEHFARQACSSMLDLYISYNKQELAKVSYNHTTFQLPYGIL